MFEYFTTWMKLILSLKKGWEYNKMGYYSRGQEKKCIRGKLSLESNSSENKKSIEVMGYMMTSYSKVKSMHFNAYR